MAFVAEKGYVHLDLAARNVLLGANNSVKVADFGLANLMDENRTFFLPPGTKLPMKWMSTESMDRRIFSEASDVWAFGITVWELFSYGATPYEGIKNLELQDMVRNGYRLDEPDAAVDGLHDYCVSDLWAANPKDRPPFVSIEKKFKELASQFPKPVGDLGNDLATYDPKAALTTTLKRPRWYVDWSNYLELELPPDAFLCIWAGITAASRRKTVMRLYSPLMLAISSFAEQTTQRTHW